ncbi:MAG: hypothetical protein WC420_04285, partial [Candidatus Paceibacterota bacterium]
MFANDFDNLGNPFVGRTKWGRTNFSSSFPLFNIVITFATIGKVNAVPRLFCCPTNWARLVWLIVPVERFMGIQGGFPVTTDAVDDL